LISSKECPLPLESSPRPNLTADFDGRIQALVF
jgi:hypothetical protein